jgi:hypothetical protein
MRAQELRSAGRRLYRRQGARSLRANQRTCLGFPVRCSALQGKGPTEAYPPASLGGWRSPLFPRSGAGIRHIERAPIPLLRQEGMKRGWTQRTQSPIRRLERMYSWHRDCTRFTFPTSTCPVTRLRSPDDLAALVDVRLGLARIVHRESKAKWRGHRLPLRRDRDLPLRVEPSPSLAVLGERG